MLPVIVDLPVPLSWPTRLPKKLRDTTVVPSVIWPFSVHVRPVVVIWPVNTMSVSWATG